VKAHLELDPQAMAAFRKEKFPVVPSYPRANAIFPGNSENH
jgi:hypothetical protein